LREQFLSYYATDLAAYTGFTRFSQPLFVFDAVARLVVTVKLV